MIILQYCNHENNMQLEIIYTEKTLGAEICSNNRICDRLTDFLMSFLHR